jgi:hypothetical protein
MLTRRSVIELQEHLCRNARTKRTMRTKPQHAVESLSVKSAVGGLGLFFGETQGGRRISSGCSLFNYL